MAAVRLVALLAFVLCLSLYTGRVHAQNSLKSIQQDCSALAPEGCAFQPVTTSDGEISFDSYQEICPNETHTCASVDVRQNSYEYTNPSTGIRLTIEPSFCDFDYLKTKTFRLQKNTGLPLGVLEDRFAKCLSENLNLKLLVSNCRDLKLWTCDDCLNSYKRWACTTIFKECASSGVNPSETKLTCRDTCFDMVRKCPANVMFKCSDNDNRDYSDDVQTCYTL